MATYNGERYIQEQMDSLVAQDAPPDEVVITDDGSTDDTLAIIREYQRHAPFDILVHENGERLGYRRNFRRCANLCRGELIFFCDQDDVWARNKISRMAREFADPGVLFAYHNVTILGRDGTAHGVLYDRNDEEYLLSLTPVPAWHDSNGLTQCFHRSLLAHDRFWDLTMDHRRSEMMAHDQWFMFLALVAGRVSYVDDPLVQYRQHAGNVYGAERRWGNMRSIGTYWAHFPNADARLMDAANHRTEVIEKMASDGLVSSERLRCLVSVYQREHGLASCRRSTYAGNTLGERWRAFLTLLWSGGYGMRSWGEARMGWPYFPRDLVRGVLQGPWTGA